MSYLSGVILRRTAALAIVTLTLAACAKDVPPMNCVNADFDCYVNQAVGGIRFVRENIAYWSNVNLFGQGLVVLASMVATVMIALQGDENRFWTRPIGLVATALVTGVTSALISFHVPDNVDKLVDILGNMTTSVNEFDYQASKLKAGKTKQQIDAAYQNDPQFREKVIELTKMHVDKFNGLKIELLKLSGTASRLNTVSAPPPPTSQPPPAPKK